MTLTCYLSDCILSMLHW